MPRRKNQLTYPTPLNRPANTEHPDMIKANEVEWPALADTTSTFAGLIHVIQDRITPRHFSTLGHKIVIECPRVELCAEIK